jgi:hypothetical protein
MPDLGIPNAETCPQYPDSPKPGNRARIQDDIARAIGDHRIDPDADIRADC